MKEVGEFKETQKLIEEFKELGNKIPKLEDEIKQNEIKSEQRKVRLEQEMEISDEDRKLLNENQIKEVISEYQKQIEDEDKNLIKKNEAIKKEIEESKDAKKYFRTDAHLKTITMEIEEMKKEVSREELELKKKSLELQDFYMEENHENPTKWAEIYKEQDNLKKNISLLKEKIEEYSKFKEELISIDLTPDEYKEMFRREEERINSEQQEQEEPVQEEQEEPEQEKPEQTKPVQEEPIQEKPAQGKPVQEEPVQEKPVQGKPVQEKPNKDKSGIIEKITITPRDNELFYTIKTDKGENKILTELDYSKKAFKNDEIKEILEKAQERIGETFKLDILKLDPNILKALKNKEEILDQYIKAVFSKLSMQKFKLPFELNYDLKGLKDAGLKWRERHNVRKVAKEVKDLENVNIEKDPNLFSKIKEMFARANTKRLKAGIIINDKLRGEDSQITDSKLNLLDEERPSSKRKLKNKPKKISNNRFKEAGTKVKDVAKKAGTKVKDVTKKARNKFVSRLKVDGKQEEVIKNHEEKSSAQKTTEKSNKEK